MEGFHHTYPIQVRFRDIDAMNHVNNAVYITYLEAARINYIRQIAYQYQDFPLKEVGMILAEVTCTFKRPILYGQEVLIGTRVARMGTSSYRLESRIEADGMLSALGNVVVVHYDYVAGRSVPIPDQIRTRIAEYENLTPDMIGGTA